jgi:hypothetical protein
VDPTRPRKNSARNILALSVGGLGHQNSIQLLTVASQALHMSQLSGGSVEGIGVGGIKSQNYLGLESHLDQIRKLVVSEG